MKKINLLLAILLIFSCAQKKNVIIDNSVISQKKVERSGIQLVLNSVSNDSRCPENTNCIWAGEVTIAISVFESAKILETKTVVINSKNQKENLAWISKYFPNQKIKSISVLPYPKSDVITNPKDYYVKVLFE